MIGRRHYPRTELPPVASLRAGTDWYPLGPAEARVLREAGRRLKQSDRVPDVVRDKGVKLSRAERRALKEKQMSFESIEAFPQYSQEGE